MACIDGMFSYDPKLNEHIRVDNNPLVRDLYEEILASLNLTLNNKNPKGYLSIPEDCLWGGTLLVTFMANNFSIELGSFIHKNAKLIKEVK